MLLYKSNKDERDKRCYVFVIFFILILSILSGHAQTLNFPYNIAISTVEGNCYDDCHIIITIKDNANNVVEVNPQTHNAQDTGSYPLYNIQYHYRNVSAGMNTQFDTVNDIQVNSGIYCVGVTAYVPNPDFSGGFLMVDTTVCNINVLANYEHLEASVLSTMAQNNSWTGQEFCGYRASFACEDRGRIQLMLTNGKFPYYVTILNEQMDTVRQRSFWQRAQSGLNNNYADYRDYYTFDSMAVGNYLIYVSDSCGYSIALTFTIPDISPTNYGIYAFNNIHCGDSNVVYFQLQRSAIYLHDYDFPYMDSIVRYRFINPGADTTAWYFPYTSPTGDMYSMSITDTLSLLNNYCSLYDDTISVEVENLCTGQSIIGYFYYTRNFSFSNNVITTRLEENTIPDTCFILKEAGIVTQTYDYSGYPWWCGGCTYSGGSSNYPQRVPSRLYSCPVSYDVWSNIDTSLLAHNESDDFSYLGAPLMFTVDTTIPVHITITDAHGCLLAERDEIFTYNVETNVQDTIPYSFNMWVSRYWCQGDGYILFLEELGVNSQLFRKDMTIHLFESPLYNHFNLTAVCQNGVWSYELEDTTNHSTSINPYMGTEQWQFGIYRLVPGKYLFELSTSCGIDTLTCIVPNYYYRDSIAFLAPTQFSMQQVCDRLIVQPSAVSVIGYEYYIDSGIDNNEPMMRTFTPNYYLRVAEGMAGGYNEWPDENGRFVFTVPGRYVIETHANTSCVTVQHYDTIEYVPQFIDHDLGYAIICGYQSDIGNVLTHAIQGTAPYNYYLYSQPDLSGNILESNTTGYFYNIPMVEGQQFSVLVNDSCHNSYYINLTAAPLNQSVMAWELGDNVGHGHCEGDTVHLSGVPFPSQANYQWTGPNGFSSGTRMTDVVLPYNGESGWYVLEILNTGCSNVIRDSVYIQLIRAPRVSIISDSTVCPGAEANIGFAVQGNNMVDFTIYHTGAPTSGSEAFSVNANDTLFLQYSILSDNLFWVDNITDHVCAYQYLVDSVTVAVQHVYDGNPLALNTTDGYACYGQSATLGATAPLTTPYYVFWYDNPQQEHLLKCDTITEAGTTSFCQIEQLLGDSSLYVSVSNQEYCARRYGTFYHLITMHDGSTSLNAGECARLFDSGGESHNYGDNEHYSHTVTCNGNNHLNVFFNLLDIAVGDTLYIYSGSTQNPDSVLMIISGNTHPSAFTVHSSSVTFVFNSNWINNREGWNIDILTGIPMTEVYGHISPIRFDTIIDGVCPSFDPYQVEGISDIDVSHPMCYVLDTLRLVNGTCESMLHLELTVYQEELSYDTIVLVENQLPYNFAVADTVIPMGAPVVSQFSYHLSTIHYCDSTIVQTVIIHYNTSETVDTTVCIASLPYIWHGHEFAEAGAFTDTLLNDNGSSHYLTWQLAVSNPTVTIQTTHHITCYGGSDGSVGVLVSGGVQPYNCHWVNAAGTTVSSTAQLNNQPAGTYRLFATDAIGCQVKDSVMFNHLSDTMIAGGIADDREICYGLVLAPFSGTVATGGLNSVYQWQQSVNGIDWTPAPATNNTQDYTYPNAVTADFYLRRAWISVECGTVYSDTVSIITHSPSADTILATVCQGSPYQDYGFVVSAEETNTSTVIVRSQLLQNMHNCDSTVILQLTVNPIYNQNESQIICQSDLPYNWRDTTFQVGTVTGNYVFYRHTVKGCDSTVTLHLTVNPVYNQNEAQIICQNDLPYSWRDTLFQEETTTGDYVFHRHTINGCDSTVTLHLTVNQSYSQTESHIVCQNGLPFNWRDTTFQEGTVTGDYIFHRHTIKGCDSVVTLQLTVNPIYDINIEDVVCEGDGYNKYGFSVPAIMTHGVSDLNFTQNLLSHSECDSVVNLHLTVVDTAIAIVSPTSDFCDEYSAELTVESNMTEYLWSTGENTQTITVTRPGLYTVTAMQDHCKVSAAYTIETCEINVYLPNAITPGVGDGLNDYFCLHDGYKPLIKDFEIHIYNRWGELMFYSNDKNFKWNGEYNGRINRNVVYTYLINFMDNNGVPYQLKGSFIVL